MTTQYHKQLWVLTIRLVTNGVCACRQRHVNKQQVLQRAIQRMRRSELSRCFYLWKDRFGEVDDYARKRRKVWPSILSYKYDDVTS